MGVAIMEDIRIPQENLPGLGQNAKRIINDGLWVLYAIESDNSENKYLLAAGNKYYYLDTEGRPIEELDRRPSGIKLKGNVYFSDLPSPNSTEILSNLLLCV